jgi:hypothetical protein
MKDYYQHISLDPSTSELRLVTLANGEWDDPIQCHLHHVYLDEKPLYEALSYVWGDATITRDIHISGNRFAVTANLEIALRFLRLKKEPRCLWIDAICINQNDIPERNRQVKRMRDIYSSASRVLTWLGEGSDDSDKGMAEIEDIGRLIIKHDKDLPLPTGTPEQFSQLQINLENRNWSALFGIMQRKYWTRIWIVQEFASSGSFGVQSDGKGDRGLIGCGLTWMPRYLFNNAIFFISYLTRSVNNFIMKDNDYMEPFRTMLSMGRIPAFQMSHVLSIIDENPSIFDLMRSTSFLNSTDPRDKIYALLGLAHEMPGFSADYAESVQQIYKKLTSSVIIQDRNLACLGGNRTMKVNFSPSWAAAKQGIMDVGTAWMNNMRLYSACGRQESDAHFDEELKLLRCSGILIGSLKTVIGPLSRAGLESLETQHINTMGFDILWEYARNAGKAHRDDLWRTLVMDQDIFDFDNPIFPAPPEFEKQYAVLVEGYPLPKDFEPELPEEKRPLKFFERYCRCFDECTTNRCFFVTDSMHMGLGPFLTEAGDVVAVLAGGDFCLVLRPKGDYFELVGEAYVHGVMRGELMNRDGNSKLINGREFILC